MMDYDRLIAPAAAAMRPSGIRKFFDLAAEMPECISLGVGEPDFKTPWAVREAGIESLEHGRTRYTSGIVAAIMDCEQYMLNEEHFVLETENIFIDLSSRKIELMFLPVENELLAQITCAGWYDLRLSGGLHG